MSVLLLGFLIGLKHALEADHVAAVASLVNGSHSVRQAARIGVAWGLGHTATLLVVGGVVLATDAVVSAWLAHALELAVGVMLVVLGADVLRRLIADRVHFHFHTHFGGVRHFHAHSHRGESLHRADRHDHEHSRAFPVRAVLVGLVHGLAGSAALILLTLASVESVLQGLVYVVLFGLGSVLGMAVLSAVIAVPLRASARGLTWLYSALQGALGLVTMILGGALVHQTASAL